MTTTTAPIADDTNWEKIAFYLRHALSLFGDPAKLAQQLWISARDHALFSHFIRPLEAAVRQLIFIAALELAPMPLPHAPERKYLARLGMPANAGATFDMAQPQTWCASFKLGAVAMDRRRPAGMPASVSKNAGEDAGGPYRPRRISSAPSAHRLEALLRAYEQRDKLAAALARKLARTASSALNFILRRKQKRGRFPAYVTLDFTDKASAAHQTWLHKRLDALLPKTDSS
jgi:hypothetical protein